MPDPLVRLATSLLTASLSPALSACSSATAWNCTCKWITTSAHVQRSKLARVAVCPAYLAHYLGQLCRAACR